MAQIGAFYARRANFIPHTRQRRASHNSTPGPTAAEGAGGTGRPGCGAHGQQRHHRLPNFARNLSWSFFETPKKQCNSNDANSMFEQAPGELRAKLMGGGGARPGFEPTRRAIPQHAKRRQCGGRRRDRKARPQSPWVVAGSGRAPSERPTLQTSSNQHDSNRLARTPVTNVVNLSPKTTIISEIAVGLTTFVTTDQKSTRKTPWIDDVCNNTHQSTPKTVQFQRCKFNV